MRTLPCLLLAVCAVHGMIEDILLVISPTDRSIFKVAWEFEFMQGGTLHLRVALDQNLPSAHRPNNSLQYLFCTSDNLNDLKKARIEDVCGAEVFDFVQCVRQTNLGVGYNQSTTWHMRMPYSGWYKLLQLNCHEDYYKTQLTLTAINPGGEYLSVSDINHKTVYMVASSVWALLSVAWVGNWYLYRHFNVQLQSMLTIVPASRALETVSQVMLWDQMSATGRAPELLRVLTVVLECVALGIFYASLLVIAKGLGITKASLSWFEKKQVGIFSSWLVVSYAISTVYSGFVLFFYVIAMIMFLRLIFSAIVENCAELGAQIMLVRNINITTPAWRKLRMFKKFQISMVIYISVYIIFSLWATIFLSQAPWVDKMIVNSILVVMAVTVGWTFRLRPFRPYMYRIRGGDSEMAFISGGGSRGDAPGSRGDRGVASTLLHAPSTPRQAFMAADANHVEWRPGRPLPSMRGEGCIKDDNPIVLVKTPFSQQASRQAQQVYEPPTAIVPSLDLNTTAKSHPLSSSTPHPLSSSTPHTCPRPGPGLRAESMDHADELLHVPMVKGATGVTDSDPAVSLTVNLKQVLTRAQNA